MTLPRGWKQYFAIHDEVSYEWKPNMDDVVWCRDSNGVVHLWYKLSESEGCAGCGVPRKDIQQFFVMEEPVTCLTCLATKDNVPEGAADLLVQQLQASLRAPTQTMVGDYAPGDAEATLEMLKKSQEAQKRTGYVPTINGRKRRIR
jgi:hypothetical protein